MSAQITEKFLQDFQEYHNVLRKTVGPNDFRLNVLFQHIVDTKESAMILRSYEELNLHVEHRSLSRLNYAGTIIKLKDWIMDNSRILSCDQIFICTQLVKLIVTDG